MKKISRFIIFVEYLKEIKPIGWFWIIVLIITLILMISQGTGIYDSSAGRSDVFDPGRQDWPYN